MVIRNILIVAALLLLPLVLSADTSVRLDSIRVEIFRQLNMPDTGNATVTKNRGNTIINRAIERVCDDFPAIEKLDTIALAEKTRDYALNSDFERLNWALKLSKDTAVIPLQYSTVPDLFELRGGLQGADPQYNNEALPRFAFAHNDKIYFYPQAQYADTVILAYFATDSLLQVDASTTQILPSYMEAVKLYACHLISLTDKNFSAAQAYLNLYDRLLSLSKSESDKGKE